MSASSVNWLIHDKYCFCTARESPSAPKASCGRYTIPYSLLPPLPQSSGKGAEVLVGGKRFLWQDSVPQNCKLQTLHLHVAGTWESQFVVKRQCLLQHMWSTVDRNRVHVADVKKQY